MDKLKRAFRMGGLTFIIAIVVTLFSTEIADVVSVPIAIVILLFIVSIGIIFDLVGVASTAAEVAPLNAKAAKKILGAKKALFLIKHADVVASFCCDIVGDICGTISGALGAVIVFRISSGFSLNENIFEIVSLSLIASLTVSGKAFGKRIGIDRANDIIFIIGKILASIEVVFAFLSKKVCGGEDERWLSLKKLMIRRNSKI